MKAGNAPLGVTFHQLPDRHYCPLGSELSNTHINERSHKSMRIWVDTSIFYIIVDQGDYKDIEEV